MRFRPVRTSASGRVCTTKKMRTQMKQLIQHVWHEFINAKNTMSTHLVNDSIPIIWFGDLNKYSESDKKIVTVSLNPSNIEFEDKKGNKINRFPNASAIKGLNSLSPKDISTYETAMNNYFNVRPYTNWFKNPEYALHALDASYGGKMTKPQEAYHNTAIHIDIKCPLATAPTWSKLPKKIACSLDKQFKEIGYFDKLLHILGPDIILVSTNRAYIKDNFRNADGILCSSKNCTTIKINHTCLNGKACQRVFSGWELSKGVLIAVPASPQPWWNPGQGKEVSFFTKGFNMLKDSGLPL